MKPKWTPFSTLPNSEFIQDAGNNLLIPDTVSSEVYFDSIRASHNWQPERRLMVAVLEKAVMDSQRVSHIALKNVTTTQELSRRARRNLWEREKLIFECEEWFKSDDRSYLLNFASICDALEIDSGYLRQNIDNWKKITLDSKGAKTMPNPHLRSSQYGSVGRRIIRAKRIYNYKKKRVATPHTA